MCPSLCHYCSGIPSGTVYGQMLRLSIGQVNLNFLAQVPPECRGWRAIALLPFGSWQGISGIREVGWGTRLEPPVQPLP